MRRATGYQIDEDGYRCALPVEALRGDIEIDRGGALRIGPMLMSSRILYTHADRGAGNRGSDC